MSTSGVNLIGVLMMPWKLIADPGGYIFKWLLGYSGGLGAIAGVIIVDYWVIRKKQLILADLYRRDGRSGRAVRTKVFQDTSKERMPR